MKECDKTGKTVAGESQSGAIVNQPDEEGYTPLHLLAVIAGNRNTFTELIRFITRTEVTREEEVVDQPAAKSNRRV